jgi:phospholipid/cholesterol/gamma-HCH transport system substrate-binding protein
VSRLRLPTRGGSIAQFRDMNPVPIGVVSVVVLIAMIALSLNISKLPFTGGRTYSAAFTEAAGLRPGDQVEVGGVPVGKISGVSLEGTHVRVTFSLTNSSVHLGMQSTASIQIATLLGNKYVALSPNGTGQWPSNHEIPVSHTTSPYDIEPALQGLSNTVSKINTKQLATALDTLSTTFKNSPASLRSTLAGLSRLSQTIASRDAELSTLLQHTSAVTAVLAQRRQQFTQILGDGDNLLQELEQRRQVIDQLLVNTTDLATQLTGLVHDNQKSLKPMLTHLHGVLTTLDSNQGNLDQIIKGLYVFVRGEVDATGAGPWFDGTAINVTDPCAGVDCVPGSMSSSAMKKAKVSTARPRTLNGLLGIGKAEKALGVATP